jgi:tRNA-splicing ligase RtcB
MYRSIPTGVGEGRRDLRLSGDDLAGVLRDGAAWAVDRGMGFKRDLAGARGGRQPAAGEGAQVSPRARERGGAQLGTLGSGNHFAEVQRVAEIYDERAARAFGLARDQVTVMIHSGSRGLGHQVCTDHLKGMLAAAERHGIELPDRQLACAPLASPEGSATSAAMAAAANFAFANRQVMTHFVRESFAKATGTPVERLGIEVVYDVCHNIAKMETFEVDGRRQRACVHRKGATRAYPPGTPRCRTPIARWGSRCSSPATWGRYSYVLAGTQKAYEQTFGSSCHGAGRLLSRGEAKRRARGRRLMEELEEKGIVVMAAGMATVAEEMPEAYKDVADVVEVVANAGNRHQGGAARADRRHQRLVGATSIESASLRSRWPRATCSPADSLAARMRVLAWRDARSLSSPAPRLTASRRLRLRLAAEATQDLPHHAAAPGRGAAPRGPCRAAAGGDRQAGGGPRRADHARPNDPPRHRLRDDEQLPLDAGLHAGAGFHAAAGCGGARRRPAPSSTSTATACSSTTPIAPGT